MSGFVGNGSVVVDEAVRVAIVGKDIFDSYFKNRFVIHIISTMLILLFSELSDVKTEIFISG